MITAALRRKLEEVLPSGGIVDEELQLRTYESDGLAHLRATPGLVVLPETTAQVAATVAACNREDVPFVARGSGTGLSGGALPDPEGVLIVLTRMRRVLDVDVPNQRMTVQPGVTNREITRQVADHDLYYAPDPSSQTVCSIGGNIAENSGGVHCLKYGFTTNHVLALQLVTPEGEVVWLGSPHGVADAPGYDLRGVVIGSEGTLGIVTRAVVRLLRAPKAVETLAAEFDSVADAGEAVASIIRGGLVPAAMEMLDNLAIQAAEADAQAGLNREAAAVLLVEVDGPAAQVEAEFEAVQRLCRDNGATELRVAEDAQDRELLWKARKAAFASMGRLSPDYYVQDGVIPRARLGEVLDRIDELSAEYGLRVANVFHAGDGNLHPLVLYDAAEGEAELAEELAMRIIELCVEAGGSITGEHGVGVDKACVMPRMFGEEDIAVMLRVKEALDPSGLSNPDKAFPTPRLCGERPGPYRPHPVEEAGLAQRV